jgi:hypothetical protein
LIRAVQNCLAARDVSYSKDLLLDLLIAIDREFERNIPAAIDAVTSGALRFNLDGDHWQLNRRANS